MHLQRVFTERAEQLLQKAVFYKIFNLIGHLLTTSSVLPQIVFIITAEILILE